MTDETIAATSLAETARIAQGSEGLRPLRTQATPSGLLAGEEALLAAVANGRPCVLGGGVRPDGPSDDNRVRGAFLRVLALGADRTLPVDPQGVVLSGAYVEGPLYLAGADCPSALRLTHCLFDHTIALDYARIPLILLDGSHTPGVRADLAQVARGVFLRDGFRSTGQVRFYGARIGDDLDCRGAHFALSDPGDDEERAVLVCSNAAIGGSLWLNTGAVGVFRAEGQIRLVGATIAGDWNADGASFDNGPRTAVDARSLTVGGTVSFAGVTVAGRLDLAAASVGGDVILTGHEASAALPVLIEAGASADPGIWRADQTDAPQPAQSFLGLSAQGIHVARRFRLGGWLPGPINLDGARIGRDLDCTGCALDGCGALALSGVTARIDGTVFLRTVWDAVDRVVFEARGGVALTGATIGGDLNCVGGRFDNGAGVALDASNARISGSVYLSGFSVDAEGRGVCFASHGPVHLLFAEIAGNLYCAGGQFDGEGAWALRAAGVKIGGLAEFSQADDLPHVYGPRFSAWGGVDLAAASIGSYLQCLGGRFSNPGGTALGCSAIKVGGSVFLSRQPPPRDTAARATAKNAPFESEGRVDFKFAQIALVMLCQGGRFSNRSPDETWPAQAGAALDLRGANIRTLQLGMALPDTIPAWVEGSIDVSGAAVVDVIDKGFVGAPRQFPRTTPALAAAGAPAGSLDCVMTLEGFTYQRFGWDSPTDAATRLAWLDRQPARHLGRDVVLAQPFDQLTRVLRSLGQDDQAIAVAIEKQKRLTALYPAAKRVLTIGLLLVLVGAELMAERFVQVSPAAEAAASLLGWVGVLGSLLALYWSGGIGWLSRMALAAIAAYGYRPTRILVIAVVIGAGLAPVYRQAAEQGVLAPKPSVGEALPAGCGPDWTRCRVRPLIPLVYSFDTMLPLKLGEAEKWTLERRPFTLRAWGRGIALPVGTLNFLAWVEIVFGWIASGIILALISGLLKKE